MFDWFICFLILMILLRNFKRPVLRNKNDGLVVVLGSTIILMGAFYMLGFKTDLVQAIVVYLKTIYQRLLG